MARNPKKTTDSVLAKVSTGFPGFDEITGGGVPKGRCTLIAGAAGTGKTLFAMQFIAHAARDLGEPGVYMTFEESAEELTLNVASIGYDIAALVGKGTMLVDHVYVERKEIVEAGEYDLDGLFLRIGAAIDQIKAKRVVLDTLEVLFSAFPSESILRAELRRLFRWLKDRGVTTLITAEKGSGTITRFGIEEYVSDCVIALDHRVSQEISTRRLRVIKYRGSSHETNEFPFLINRHGFSVMPITTVGLDHGASEERLSTGIPRLDTMLSGKGYYRGSSLLISGTAGTGKSSLAAWIAAAACRAGERCLYFAFEESEKQIIRNMRSIGNDLAPLVEKGVLRIHATRSSTHGIEQHLVGIIDLIESFRPTLVVLDPISNFIASGTTSEVKGMLTRLIDMLKVRTITGLFTSLTFGGSSLEETETTISSLMDTWILVRTYEHDGERNRGLMVLKSRGMAHSNQVREFVMGDRGIELIDVYLGTEGVLMGSARIARESTLARTQRDQAQMERKRLDLIAQKRFDTEAQIRTLQQSLAADQDELRLAEQALAEQGQADEESRQRMASIRSADPTGEAAKPSSRRKRL